MNSKSQRLSHNDTARSRASSSRTPGRDMPLVEPMSRLEEGDTLASRYQLIEKLGEGGMGRVFHAYDLEMGRSVAIKAVSPSAGDPACAAKCLRNEAAALKKLEKFGESGVVSHIEDGVWNNLDYLVIEHLEGRLLSQVIRKSGGLPWEKAKPLMLQMCGTLCTIHKGDMVFSDLKPDNVMLERDRGAVLFDFGLIRIANIHTGAYESGVPDGLAAGTLEYMPPEQLLGKQLDPRSDIYSAGAMFFEMLSGRPPFVSGEREKLELMVLVSEPPPMRAQVPAAAAKALLRAMEKSPESRFQCAADLREALEKA